MPNLSIQIIELVDSDQPGWVKGEFSDASGRKHTIIEKSPVLGGDYLAPQSEVTFPRSAQLRCSVLKQWRDEEGRDLSRIDTEYPDGIESTEGLSEFVVLAEQLTP